jgi:hypothetical protein
MSEELKDEVICIAHSSIECSQRDRYSNSRICNLEIIGNRPYIFACDFRIRITAPVVKEEPLPEIPELKPIEPMSVKPTTDELPF